MRFEPLAGAGLLALAAGCHAPSQPIHIWELAYEQDFSSAEDFEGFAFSDARAWRWSDGGERAALELYGASDYTPPFRSPRNIALLPGLEFGDFDMEVELLQTGRDYGHRDMCLFFGFESPERFYYVHLAPAPDQNAHNVFLVDGAPRRNLLEPQLRGVDWGVDVWHTVRIERRVVEGSIAVHWDGSEQPILVAFDETIDWGRIGFGSFDDTGRVTAVRIWAPESRALKGEGQPFQ